MTLHTVLVVDDDPSVGSQLEQEFHAGSGIVLHVATTAAAAIDLLNENRYEAIVLDLVLGTGNGLDVLYHVRSQGVPTPVMVISAWLPDYVRELLGTLDLVRMIHAKPIHPKALAGVVESWVAHPNTVRIEPDVARE
jgi:DNA-binding response OmpR family regulator